MRIVHISDIHFSKKNYNSFKNIILPKLIEDLKEFHNQIKIDIIIISGDLLDRGGNSILAISDYCKDRHQNPYDFFNEYFIDPILQNLGIEKKRVLFVPGNHDVDENNIKLIEEKKLIDELKINNSCDFIEKNENENINNERILAFKNFEKQFHEDNLHDYSFSLNQSTYIFEDQDGFKYGFLLINDSWRCKSIRLECEKDTRHIVGEQQFHNGLRELKSKEADINICVLHHELSNFIDENEIKSSILTSNIEVVLYGHYHKAEFCKIEQNNNNYIGLRCRALNGDVDINDANYRSGYQILDFEKDFLKRINYRYFNNGVGIRKFMSDNNGGYENGIDDNNGKWYKLNYTSNDKFYNIEDFINK